MRFVKIGVYSNWGFLRLRVQGLGFRALGLQGLGRRVTRLGPLKHPHKILQYWNLPNSNKGTAKDFP